MKPIIFFLIFSAKAFSQASDSANFQFSEAFKTYSKKYSKLLVQYPGSLGRMKWTHYSIIYEAKRKWYLAEYFSDPLKLFNDSISIRKCDDCKAVYQQLLSKEKQLKSEKEIMTPCRKRTLVVTKSGDSAVSEQDLKWIADLGIVILEYRINKKERKVWQLRPEVALDICPESMERRTFLDLLNAIKNAH